MLHLKRNQSTDLLWKSFDWIRYDSSIRPLLIKSLSIFSFNPSGVNPTKLSDTLKKFVGYWPTNCLSVFDHFVGLALKELKTNIQDGFCLEI